MRQKEIVERNAKEKRHKEMKERKKQTNKQINKQTNFIPYSDNALTLVQNSNLARLIHFHLR